MDWQSQLITVFLTTCDFFSQLSPTSFLKISPNSNLSFTEQEVVTIYIFGVLMKQKNIKSIFNFTKDFIANWFPHLPSYEGFLSRLSSLSKIFLELANFILKNKKFNYSFPTIN